MSPAGYSPWGRQELDATEQKNNKILTVEMQSGINCRDYKSTIYLKTRRKVLPIS